MLGVDAASPTGANRLHQGLGFEEVMTPVAHLRRVNDA